MKIKKVRGLSSLKQKKEPFVNYRLEKAELVTVDTIRVIVESSHEIDRNGWSMINSDGEYPLNVIVLEGKKVELSLGFPFPFGENSYVMYKGIACYLEITEAVRTKEFDDLFYYDGKDLGVHYQKEKANFAVWAPTATRLNVIIFQHWYEEKGVAHSCQRDEKGVWRLELEGNHEGNWYLFEVYVNQTWRQVVDPYAKFLCVNGEKAMIGDLSLTEPDHWPDLFNLTKNDVVIYELHIRDFTISPTNGIENKGRYLGLAETGLKDKDMLATGLDYLTNLGITHVELLPVQEYGSVDESNRDDEYNWGYDTTHFFVPEGSYASDPYDGQKRIREFKQLIAALHENQLRVIMDVVFNHVYIWEESALDLLVPGYFFRYTPENEISDGTGVGNDFASERKMARKMIVDAICYWLKEYRVDGFRFDLMGILDIETMKQVREEATKINEDVLIFGEGWNLPTAYPVEKRAVMEQALALDGVGFFQDKFRDGLKGSTFNIKEPGFISGHEKDSHAIVHGIKGSIGDFKEPIQAINYVEAHDNHTLWDKLKLVHPYERRSLLVKRQLLATSIILLSQGIPFIHAGQEWFRTKHGVENSYNQPDWINAFDWNQRAYFNEHVEYVQKLIRIRRNHPAFRLETYELINKHLEIIKAEPQCIAYQLKDLGKLDDWKDIIVIHNASFDKQHFFLPENKNWQVFVDDSSVSLIPLDKIGEDCVQVSPLSTFVLASL